MSLQTIATAEYFIIVLNYRKRNPRYGWRELYLDSSKAHFCNKLVGYQIRVRLFIEKDFVDFKKYNHLSFLWKDSSVNIHKSFKLELFSNNSSKCWICVWTVFCSSINACLEDGFFLTHLHLFNVFYSVQYSN